MDRRNALYRLFKRNKSTVSWEAFKVQRNHVTALQRKAKKEYFHHLLKKKVSPSSLWNILKTAGASSPHTNTNWSSLNITSTSIANTLNSHFVKVSSTLSSGSLPPPKLPSLESTLTLLPTNPIDVKTLLLLANPDALRVLITFLQLLSLLVELLSVFHCAPFSILPSPPLFFPNPGSALGLSLFTKVAIMFLLPTTDPYPYFRYAVKS